MRRARGTLPRGEASLPDHTMLRSLLASAIGLVVAPCLGAQQFLSQTLPGPDVWSECAIPFDADEDGDLDVLILNAQGWNSPGDFDAPSTAPLPPTLLLNGGNDGNDFPIWTDASAAMLPAGLVFHAKWGVAGDFDGDGHTDVAIATAFGDQQRLLRKDPLSGTFVDVTATNLPTLVLNSQYVAAGDLDDDGDLDLVFTDSGPQTFAAPGGQVRLLLNDGAGVFVDASAQLGAANKIGAQNAKLVDIDGDLDLDICVDGKSPVSQLYRNDGSANFTLDTTTLPSSPQSNDANTYETEYGDLDGDGDFDAMLMNFGQGFRDAAVQNTLAQNGVLEFRPPSLAAIAGPNAHDENDFAYFDADDDGDLDVLVGVLNFSVLEPLIPEKLLLNSGTFGVGFLTDVPGAFDVGVDATLDLALGDFNDDGAYDLVSVQGEFLPFRNVFHKNVGPVDTQPPRILRITPGSTTVRLDDVNAGIPLRALITDAIVDDGITYAMATLTLEADKSGELTSMNVAMPHVGGYVHRAAGVPVATSQGLVGADLTWRVTAFDPAGQSTIAGDETARICGVETYGAAGPLVGLALSAAVDAVLGEAFSIELAGGTPSTSGLLIVGFARFDAPLRGGTLLVNPTDALFVPLDLDGSGAAILPAVIPPDVEFAGFGAMLQYGSFDATQSGGLALSNGLEFVICEN